MSESTRFRLSPDDVRDARADRADRVERPRRRISDGGFRQLFTPKSFLFVILLVSGSVFAAGKWVGARDHNDGTLIKDIAGVSDQVTALDARTKLETLDHRYVTYDALHAEINGQKADLEWIKSALIRLEAKTGK